MNAEELEEFRKLVGQLSAFCEAVSNKEEGAAEEQSGAPRKKRARSPFPAFVRGKTDILVFLSQVLDEMCLPAFDSEAVRWNVLSFLWKAVIGGESFPSADKVGPLMRKERLPGRWDGVRFAQLAIRDKDNRLYSPCFLIGVKLKPHYLETLQGQPQFGKNRALDQSVVRVQV